MSKFWIIGLSCISFFLISNVSAQLISQQQFEASFPNRLHTIGVKLYTAAIRNTITAYNSDSLASVCSQEYISKVGRKEIKVIIHNWRYPNDPSDLIDSMIYSELSMESILNDLSLTYSTSTDNQFRTILELKSIAPTYNYSTGGLSIVRPIAWFSKQDLYKALNQNEVEFINYYAWWKSFEPSNYINCEDQKTVGLNVVWADLGVSQKLSIFGNYSGNIIGPWISNDISTRVFDKFNNDEILIKQNGQVVKRNLFYERHKFQLAPSISNWSSPSDLTIMQDTTFWAVPTRFDSIYFIRKGSEVEVVLGEFERHDEKKSKMTFYTVLLSDLKKYMMPIEYRLIELAIME